MVRIYILTILLFSTLSVYSQENDSFLNKYASYSAFDITPQFNGDLDKFIKDNLVYPPAAIKEKLEGNVLISFWINIDGTTSGYLVEKGSKDFFNIEALRVAKLINFTKPAYSNDKPIRIKYYYTFRFKLPNKKKCKNRR